MIETQNLKLNNILKQMNATKIQKQLIHINTPNRDIKEEFVQWATDSIEKISCNDLNFEQANMILVQLGKEPHKASNYAVFDKTNNRHKYILSLCITYGWSKWSAKFGKIANLDKLNEWMHSKFCPVQKPLKKMNSDELDKFIAALESMTVKKFGNLNKTRQ
jgi:hypothetical protein